MHLAEYNFGMLRHGWDDPRSAAFVEGLDLVNGVADRANGFVWRATDADVGTDGAVVSDLAPEDRARLEHEDLAATLSIWESVEALEQFVWKTVHRQFYARKAEWYDAVGNGNLVLWWVAEGERPTSAEGMARWRHLQDNGNTDHAFGWSYLKEAQAWKTHACAPMAAE
ncbi:MAG: DUF3291 domain-containing protein [Cypionkella sp.]|uniref:DUF3291 domain-containing protein n=1 Tax=Cypionkella sp. TaxID=2811411 RepID=UPI002ABCE8A1|nr:DUF3291 domain-containing protein [Cypionkella sp.]MDZ4309226.1 DUF3291 domain-containing protein [Cypionkella sp.]MDZ4395186.1 DUF3291 domain-containing protein [Cypionkella sp.]